MKFHDAAGARLIEAHEAATAAYWDRQWSRKAIGAFRAEAVAPYVELTRQYLPAGAQVLEGGCGTGSKLAALAEAGFRVTGVDFAEATVARLQAERPDLHVMVGDVCALPLPVASVDGYWSFGVIEHFWGGYDRLLAEAHRVLRPGGWLFMTFPALSPLRRAKAALHLYRRWPHGVDAAKPAGFYQFMLAPSAVCAQLRTAGFEVQPARLIQASHGLKNELPRLWRASRQAGRLLPAAWPEALARRLERHLAASCGHLGLLAARKPPTAR